MLIFNADDFFNSELDNHRIINSLSSSVIKSTTIVSNKFYFDEKIQEVVKQMSVGIHVNLVEGVALTGPSSITDSDGVFHSKKHFLKKMYYGLVRKNDIINEIDAQFFHLVNLGIHPSHIDSHQNLHIFPTIFKSILQVAKKYEVRKIRAQRFKSNWFDLNNSFYDRIRNLYSNLIVQDRSSFLNYPSFTILKAPGLGLSCSVEEAILLWERALKSSYCPNYIYEVPCHLGLSDFEYEFYRSEKFKSLLRQFNVRVGSYHDIS
jgi:predicted glycoside hydrolase/deacetylase ChbG (UPF0249 family)